MIKQNVGLNNKKILVTGSAGFIGSYLVKWLLNNIENAQIIGLDNMNDYYDVSLKEYRNKQLEEIVAEKSSSSYRFYRVGLEDKAVIDRLFDSWHFDIVINLAAQAGVRYSITNPDAYINSNIIGFYNILEACRNHPVEHLVYASSSSVYGGNKKVPFSTDDKVDNPVSLYAATKKSNELLAHAYSKLYNIPTTGLRFFTVYGPAGRPDMAYFGFTNKLIKGETIEIFNYGNCKQCLSYTVTTYKEYFVCRHGRQVDKHSKCCKDEYPIKVIETIVWKALVNMISTLQKLGTQVEAKTKQQLIDISKVKTETERKVALLKEERIQLYELYAAGTISKDRYILKRSEISKQIEEAEKTLSNIIQGMNNEKELLNHSTDTNALVSRFSGADRLSRAIVKAFIETVYIYDTQHIEIVFTHSDILKQFENYMSDHPTKP